MIYLDNNATTEPDKNMISAVMEEITNYFGNPSSPHYYGHVTKDMIELHRGSVANALGAKPSQIIFTSGGTEANCLALHDKMVIGSATEHSSVSNFLTVLLKVKSNGQLDLEDFEHALSNNRYSHLGSNFVVSVMHANNETGIILDPNCRLRELKEKYGFLLHVDAVQSFGKGINVNVNDLNVDFLTISAHKIHGLKGAGALYARNIEYIKPLFMGGVHEFGRRPGTENHAGIISLGYMCNKIINDSFYRNRILNISNIRAEFEKNISDIAIINGADVPRVVNTSSIAIDSITDLELFLEILSGMGLYVSGKSACSSGLPIPSKVLTAMYGPNDPRLHNTLRVSLCVNTTATDVEVACDILREARIQYLKEMEK